MIASTQKVQVIPSCLISFKKFEIFMRPTTSIFDHTPSTTIKNLKSLELNLFTCLFVDEQQISNSRQNTTVSIDRQCFYAGWCLS